MSLHKIQAFIADITALKSGSRFYSPHINIDDRYGRETSVKGLIDWLRGNFVGAAPITLSQALGHCANADDQRIVKYMPAIERLVQCWGTAAPYPAIVASTPARSRALWNFARTLRHWPAALHAALPPWDALYARAANAMGFGIDLGPGALLHLVIPGFGPVDITARGLLLRAGLAPPAGGNTGGYAACLHLTQAHLNQMAGHTILDVACGGATFRAEMTVLYNCQTDGLDLNAAHVGGALGEGQRRYARSMMYLKMLRDLGTPAVSPTPGWSAPLIERSVAHLPAILASYAANPPVVGNILAAPAAFALAAAGIRAGGWDYTTCLYLLCYFNPAQQTAAVLNMCSVTNRAVFLHSGGGLTPFPQLNYDPAAVLAAHPGCHIEVIDAQTHHIRL